MSGDTGHTPESAQRISDAIEHLVLELIYEHATEDEFDPSPSRVRQARADLVAALSGEVER